MNQTQTEIHTHFSRSIKQNKLLYVTLAPSEDSSSPTPVIGTFQGYIEENKAMIGDQVYCLLLKRDKGRAYVPPF